MKILCIADVKDWVFDKTAKTLQKYGHHNYDIRYRGTKYKKAFVGCDEYDLILYFTDVRPDYIMKYRPPREKTIIMIRSDVFKLCKKGRNQFYKDANIAKEHCAAFMIANKYLLQKFMKIYAEHIPCYYAPGGVDTEIFTKETSEYYWDSPVVGWAGSTKYYGPKLRGLDILSHACDSADMEFNPAIKENVYRSELGMLEYYDQEITIYADASSTAGRQNGLLEAGACGLPLVCTPVGIGRELIDAGCAVEIERDEASIVDGLCRAWANRAELGNNAVKYIRDNYSWVDHVKKWETIFQEVHKNNA